MEIVDKLLYRLVFRWGAILILPIFPQVLALRLHKGMAICAKLIEGLTVESLKRDPRGGSKMERWEMMDNLIHAVQLLDMKDRLSLTFGFHGHLIKKVF